MSPKRMLRAGRWLAATVLPLLPSALPAASITKVEGLVRAHQAQQEVPEEHLLDVGIELFDPGLPAKDESALEEKGIFADIRKSEVRFVALHLSRTLQSTGFWGAVRVVPPANVSTDVRVRGEILESTGRELALLIEVTDASRAPWFKGRYRQVAQVGSYDEGPVERVDPYQSLYNQIANDLLAAYRSLAAAEIEEIRRVSALRFASDLLPAAFHEYLKTTKKGRLEIERLPAAGDPMMERVARIRERDHLFVDTLNEYYANFYAQMETPYYDWRSFSYEEQMSLRKIRRQARMEKILGAIAILGAATVDSSGSAGRVARTAGTLGGTMAIQDGIEKGREAKIHVAALEELAQSFDADVAPLLVDIEGQTVRLTGSVEDQYTTWRQLLRDLFAAERGLTVDPNTGAVLSVGPAASETLEDPIEE